ncbi:extensin family protein [Actinokineospora sp. 24-640]
MISFSYIDGTPVYYWRSSRGNTTIRSWQCTQAFYDSMVLWIRDLRSLSSGYGNISYLVSAGFYVNKTGQHGAGTAMDLDYVQWSGGQVSSPLDRHHASGTQSVRRRYLAVDAVCRRRFRFVLDGWYDAAHGDHIHSDFGGLPTLCSTGSESDTKFVQSMCNNFMNSGLSVDGDWGPLTQNAFTTAKSRLGVSGDPHTSTTAWRSMLSGIAQRGFANQGI